MLFQSHSVTSGRFAALVGVCVFLFRDVRLCLSFYLLASIDLTYYFFLILEHDLVAVKEERCVRCDFLWCYHVEMGDFSWNT